MKITSTVVRIEREFALSKGTYMPRCQGVCGSACTTVADFFIYRLSRSRVLAGPSSVCARPSDASDTHKSRRTVE